MKFNLHWITSKLVEVKVDDIETGTLDAKQAKELATDLISIAAELLAVED